MQLESSAAIEDERSKMKIMMNEAEVAMKDYYEAEKFIDQAIYSLEMTLTFC